MPTTPALLLPYPAPSEPADVPLDMQELATRLEAVIGGVAITLPASPVDGQEAILVDSLTAATFAWRFRYVAAKTSNKWLFVGGSPKYSEVTTAETTASLTFAALATAGPLIALPVAGDYLVSVGFRNSSQATTQTEAHMSYDIGATAAVAADEARARTFSATLDSAHSVARTRRKTGLGAVTLTAKYRTDAGTTGFTERWMEVTPIAVGG